MPAATDRRLRQILHVDMDAFYVSVEELENPSLRGKPVIVGADPNGRGVVTSASYEARQFGVHSAQPISVARKRCPHAIFLRGDYSKYREYSRRLRRIFDEFTPVVEAVSVDEAYLDLTGCERLHGSALQAADCLLRTVEERTGLNCSAGLSTSRVVAKIASDLAKPHGLLYVFPGCEPAFLAPLPVRRIPGVGKMAEARLRSLGLSRIQDVQRWGPGAMENRLGKFGEWLHTKSLGQDIEAYAYTDQPKSLSHETTFDRDTNDIGKLAATLSELAQQVGYRLREHGLFARTISLKIRFAPFRTVTRSLTLGEPTHHDSLIFSAVLSLFRGVFQPRLWVRLIGVRASNLTSSGFQRNLLDAPQRVKLERALTAADGIRRRFGFDAVRLARALGDGSRHP